MIRFGKYLDGSVKGMAKEALELVLKDAGLAKDAIQAAYVSNTFWGMFSNQHSIRGEVMLWDIGMNGIPIVNCENACAGASTALHLGYTAIRAGMYDVVLALGSEKITHTNKALSLSAWMSRTSRSRSTCSKRSLKISILRFQTAKHPQVRVGVFSWMPMRWVPGGT